MKLNNWNPKGVVDYLVRYYKNENTRDTCKVYLKTYFRTINKEPDDYVKKDIKEISEDLWKYAQLIENKPKMTQTTMLSVIKKYLTRNDVLIKESLMDDIRQRNSLKRTIQSLTKKATPSQKQLKEILAHADMKGKVLFLFCASTGCRIDEALSLTFKHIDIENRTVELPEEVTKDEYPRYTFFTEEVQELLKLWKSQRQKLIDLKYKKSKFLRNKLKEMGYDVKREQISKGKCLQWYIYKDGVRLTKDEIIAIDDRIFPFVYGNAQRMWSNILERAGVPFNTKDDNVKFQRSRYLYNIHCLRRFWYTQLTADRANTEYVNFMGGHFSELDKTYKDFDGAMMRTQLKKEYDNHAKSLFIYEIPPDLTGINEELKRKDAEIKSMERRIDELNQSMIMLLAKNSSK